ncbi:hypothetical protein Pla123a_38160 [Posidoniimonas polymericola]|uniref:Ice-binding protein C-terminal domain-containing protein n=1 Tax=Posidoniimonas polymericola TaxID=2528002 RepID=A0A5C5YDQ1_9BACT|nr:spondin domain-containing protein [Posidoniimonas polymericola]TWT73480.1 hypothetical protein Pla123a_38160 [Posidoniimonas polymericola]
MLRTTLIALTLAASATAASAVDIRVTIESLAPAGGAVLTPVWVGFHDGSFDSYDGGLSAQPGLERLAEDGNTGPISADFLAGRTYVDGGVSGTFDNAQPAGQRVDGTIVSAGPGPLLPGQTTSQVFSIASDGANRYFSYASMVLPSNDYFVANGSPTAHDLMDLLDGSGSLSFVIGAPGTVNDAGTEEEDFDFAAPDLGGLNGLFPGAGFGGIAGQTGPDQGPADATTVVANVAGDPYANFLNNDGFDLTGLNFNELPVGIARVTLTAVPEPATVALAALTLAGVVGWRRR